MPYDCRMLNNFMCFMWLQAVPCAEFPTVPLGKVEIISLVKSFPSSDLIISLILVCVDTGWVQ